MVALFLWSLRTWAVQYGVLQQQEVLAALFVLLLEPSSPMPTTRVVLHWHHNLELACRTQYTSTDPHPQTTDVQHTYIPLV